ncbi:MAG: ABC transporter permease, partial [Methanomicrobiales archaeon]|nr:ABC transporter permease [Methanomicrobiales archaeon]
MVNGSPIIEGFIEAINLIITLNPQVVEITIRSLYVSLTATFFAALIALPAGALIYFYEFRGKHAVVST